MMLFLLWDFSLLILQSYRLGPLIATLERVYLAMFPGASTHKNAPTVDGSDLLL